MNTTITDAAREAAAQEIKTHDKWRNSDEPEKMPARGHFVQLTIDAATKERDDTISALRKDLKDASASHGKTLLSCEATIAELRRELGEAKANAKYWIEQEGNENWKRGEAEHQLDLARGDKAEAFELLERERDHLRADLATTQQRLEQCEKAAEGLVTAVKIKIELIKETELLAERSCFCADSTCWLCVARKSIKHYADYKEGK